MRSGLVGLLAVSATADSNTVVLNNGVVMPRVNLGTCCGSDPDAGLPSWIAAGGVGIDTAFGRREIHLYVKQDYRCNAVCEKPDVAHRCSNAVCE